MKREGSDDVCLVCLGEKPCINEKRSQHQVQLNR